MCLNRRFLQPRQQIAKQRALHSLVIARVRLPFVSQIRRCRHASGARESYCSTVMCRLQYAETPRSTASQMRVTCHSAQHGYALVTDVPSCFRTIVPLLSGSTLARHVLTGDHPGGAGRRAAQHGRVPGHGLSSPRRRGHRRCRNVSSTAERACSSGKATSPCAAPASSTVVAAKGLSVILPAFAS